MNLLDTRQRTCRFWSEEMDSKINYYSGKDKCYTQIAREVINVNHPLIGEMK